MEQTDIFSKQHLSHTQEPPEVDNNEPSPAEKDSRLQRNDSPRTYNADIVESAFRTLYDSRDIEESVNTVLAMMGKYYGVSRSYIFEDSEDHHFCRYTFEWCAPGISSAINELQSLSCEKDLAILYHEIFENDTIFLCSDVSEEPPALRRILEPQGVRSLLQCAFKEDGVFFGLVGFDDCTGQMIWTEEMTGTLSLVSMLIGTFLLRHRKKNSDAFSADFKAALENSAEFVYIIDPDTFIVSYCNRTIRELFETDYIGCHCYEEFLHNPVPCDNCPAVALRETGKSPSVEVLRPDGMWFLAQASPLYWKGKQNIILTCTNITKQKQAEAELQVRNSEYAVIVKQSGKQYLRYDLSTGAASPFLSQGGHFETQETIADFSETLIRQGVVMPESAATCRKLFQQMRDGRPQGSCYLRVRDEDERTRWDLVEYTLIEGADGKPAYSLVSYFDNTVAFEKELAYQKWQDSLSGLFAEKAIYLEVNLTQDIIEHEENLGVENAERPGSSFTEYIDFGREHITYKADIPQFLEFFNSKRLLSMFTFGQTEDTFRYRAIIDGRPQWYRTEIKMAKAPGTDDIKAAIIYTNIEEEMREREQLMARAEIDSLTGLLNRSAVQTKIAEILKNSSGARCALLMADLDNLKSINDTFGHLEGDRALQLMADTMRRHFTETSIIGRMGGDEFMLLLQDIPSMETLCSTMASFMGKISAHQIGRDGGSPLCCSLGITFGIPGRDDFNTLYRQADIALYHVKRSGKNDFAYYRPEMEHPERHDQ